MRTAAFLLLFSVISAAQTPVAPTPQTAGDPAGENLENYNVVNSFETGYRFRTAGGNYDQYRSAVNYGNGIRLLGSSLVVNSRDGRGFLFDQIALTTQGLGNDPYEAAVLRVEKNKLYRYDMNWRLNDYFNPGLVTAGGGGQHLSNTQYRMQDHDLTLFPQSGFKVFAGFSADSQTGPAFSSIQQFNEAGDIFPLLSDVKRVRHEYRAGNEFRVFGIRVNWIRGWEDFKDDTGAALTAGVPGAPLLAPVHRVNLNQFQASSPYHGTNPYWRVAIFAEQKRFNVNGRFTYSAGNNAFVVDESAQGLAGALPRAQNVATSGTAQRPAATGNLNLNFTPTSSLTISNSTSLYNIRTLGDSVFTQFDSPSQTTTVLFYNFLGIQSVANDTNVNYQASPLWGIMAGYHYSNRLIDSREQFAFQGTPFVTPASQSNHLHAGQFGVRIRPFSSLTVLLSAELGTNSQPFTPIAGRDYHVLNGRIQYRAKKLSLSATANANYNANSVTLSSYGSQARTYSVTGSWAQREWLTIDGGWSRIHTYSIGGIAYFLNQRLATGQQSVYLSNINTVYAGVRYAILRRIDLYGGYTRVQDLGDGRSDPFGAGIGSPLSLFQAVQTFPVVYQSPVARISVRINQKLRWNTGYQYYAYRQDFGPALDFRANTGYTSLSFSF